MTWSGRLILDILSASNVVPRSRERERVVADRVRDVGEKHSSAAGTEVRCRILDTKKTEVNIIPQFLHKASLPWRDEVKRRRLIPAEFDETKTAAGRRRMWRTRQAHGSSGFAVARLTARRNSLVNNLDHPCSFDQLILRVQNQNATQTQAALPPKDT